MRPYLFIQYISGDSYKKRIQQKYIDASNRNSDSHFYWYARLVLSNRFGIILSLNFRPAYISGQGQKVWPRPLCGWRNLKFTVVLPNAIRNVKLALIVKKCIDRFGPVFPLVARKEWRGQRAKRKGNDWQTWISFDWLKKSVCLWRLTCPISFLSVSLNATDVSLMHEAAQPLPTADCHFQFCPIFAAFVHRRASTWKVFFHFFFPVLFLINKKRALLGTLSTVIFLLLLIAGRA